MILDSLPYGSVVYCRPYEGKAAVTTIARYEKKEEKVELDDKGREKIVTYYYLWDLRRSKQIVNPSNVWQTADQFYGLRASKKIKFFGDFQDESDDTPKRAKVV